MKILKIILGIVVVLILIFLIGGLFLPKTYAVSRSAVIDAPDSVIYNNIADYNKFLQWNPWSKMEPNVKTVVSGTAGQPGHQYTWEGNKTGSGQMSIKKVTPYQLVEMELRFIKPFESQADTRFDIIPEGAGRKVTWTMSGENNLFGKWMCLFMNMDKMIGPDFETGLRSLKDRSEKEK